MTTFGYEHTKHAVVNVFVKACVHSNLSRYDSIRFYEAVFFFTIRWNRKKTYDRR